MLAMIKNQANIVRVAIPLPLRGSFDYLLPPELVDSQISIGARVVVPFGKRKLVGVILKIAKHSEIKSEKLKSIIEILDAKPLFSQKMMALLSWASNYYHHPIGDVLANAMPKLLRQGKLVELSDDLISSLVTTDNFERLKLNHYQQLAVDAIDINSGFKAFLLDGVTGSGKTEVYMRVIEKVVQSGKQALVLVPEIGLTPQLIQRFQKKFAINLEAERQIAVFHSKLTDKERLTCWVRAKNNFASIIIGTRSALFTPLANFGLIILDEEHDLSFKQHSGFRYSARDLALVRAKLENIPIILGSATPSLESLYNVQLGKYVHLRLPERAGLAINPIFQLIDMRNKLVIAGLSDVLIQKMHAHLSDGGQVLLFLNRRGYAPTLLCQSCGWIAKCKRCDAKMTLHQQSKHLYCHHCGASWPILQKCADCNSEKLISLGVGTEKLEEILQQKFPDNLIIRIDRDTTKRKNRMQEVLQAIQNNQYQILIGTQMLAKGHHFPNVTMVGIVNADSGLLSSDFRACEHVAQLITQVAGRAGRVEKVGEVYIQTYNPNHPLLLSLINRGYSAFAAENLKEREFASLPPFGYLALLRAEAKTKDLALKVLTECKNLVTVLLEVRLLGPVPSLMYRKGGYYRAQLLIASHDRNHLRHQLKLIINIMEKLKSSRQVRWSLDVDPLEA
jgi:primosomal protein N' (replication factor Y) (superfamily II helicase)